MSHQDARSQPGKQFELDFSIGLEPASPAHHSGSISLAENRNIKLVGSHKAGETACRWGPGNAALRFGQMLGERRSRLLCKLIGERIRAVSANQQMLLAIDNPLSKGGVGPRSLPKSKQSRSPQERATVHLSKTSMFNTAVTT